MIVVDDRFSIEALAGPKGPVRLSRLATPEVRRAVAAPPAARLVVLDPRAVTAEAVVLAARHRLNLLAAELVAAALHHDATVRLSAANVGKQWPEVMAAEGVALEVE